MFRRESKVGFNHKKALGIHSLVRASNGMIRTPSKEKAETSDFLKLYQ